MKKITNKKTSGKSYVAEAFDFEKIATIYLSKIVFPNYQLKDLIFIKMGPKTTAGDIDVSLLYKPNISLYLQIKSNRNTKEVMINDISKGFDQLFKFKQSNLPDGVKQSKYLLIYEGYTTEENIKHMIFGSLHSSQAVSYWIEHLNKKINLDNDPKMYSEICSFIDSVQIILLPSRIDMRMILEYVFSYDDLIYLIGNLTYDRKIDNQKLLNLISKRIMVQNTQSKKSLLEKYANKLVKIINYDDFIIQESRDIEYSIVITIFPLDQSFFKGISHSFPSIQKLKPELDKLIENYSFQLSIKNTGDSYLITKNNNPNEHNVNVLNNLEKFEFKIEHNGFITFIAYPFILYEYNIAGHQDQYIQLFPIEEFSLFLHFILNCIKLILQISHEIDSNDGLYLYIGINNFKKVQLNNKLFDEEIKHIFELDFDKNQVENINFNEIYDDFIAKVSNIFAKQLDDTQYFKDYSTLYDGFI